MNDTLEGVWIDVVFTHPYGDLCIAPVSDLRRTLHWYSDRGKGLVVFEYKWSGECDAEGRPIYTLDADRLHQ